MRAKISGSADDGTLSLEPPPSQPPGRWWLRARGGPAAELRDGLVIGSGADVGLRLTDRFVSTHHALIRREHGSWWIIDLDSKNGTLVEGRRVGSALLVPRLTLSLGRYLIDVDVDSAVDHRDDVAAMVGDDAVLGRDPALLKAIAALRRFAAMRPPVLVRGETGTGKDLAARIVHAAGPRARGPLVVLNCAAIVDGLAESELFGHVRGAFSGALRAHAGAFVRASGGTLFLDEIGELPLALQAKLLRVLENGRVTPVGGEREIEVDVRVVAATHRDLEAMVGHGQLREDLYHRLGVLSVELPPLRERRDDIELLVRRFAAVAESELGRPVVVTAEAIAAARRQPWPGNVRALKHAVLRAAAVADGPIDARTLLAGHVTGLASSACDTIAVRRADWATMSHELLVHAVLQHGSIRRAAQALGMPRSTLGARLKR